MRAHIVICLVILGLGTFAGNAFSFQVGGGLTCKAFPAPVDHLGGESIYLKGDPTQSRIDSAADARYRQAMAPLWDFVKYVSRSASLYELSRDQSSAICAITALRTWATAPALEHIESRSARLNFGRNLAGIALAYKKVRSKTGLGDRRIIDDWLHGLAESASEVFSGDRTRTPYGNLRYWNSLGVAAVADITDDQHLFAWGMEGMRIGMCQANVDGSLPLEMARGRKALDYQVYATSALVMLAKLSKAHHRDPTRICNEALRRIVNFTIAASLDSRKITSKAGVGQDGALRGDFSRPEYAWIAAYQANFGPIDALSALKGPKIHSDPFLGGTVN